MRPLGYGRSPLRTRLYSFSDLPHAAYRSGISSIRQIIKIEVSDFSNL